MSTLVVRDIQGYASNKYEVKIPSGNILDIISNLQLPTWNNDSSRPSIPERGMVGYNITSGALEIYDGSQWLSAFSTKL